MIMSKSIKSIKSKDIKIMELEKENRKLRAKIKIMELEEENRKLRTKIKKLETKLDVTVKEPEKVKKLEAKLETKLDVIVKEPKKVKKQVKLKKCYYCCNEFVQKSSEIFCSEECDKIERKHKAAYNKNTSSLKYFPLEKGLKKSKGCWLSSCKASRTQN